MIGKQDILDRALEWRLRPEVVEKDYVLGWLLAGLATVPEVRAFWVFKGGTCIKKCYLETYRFSEDLDFSILPEGPYTEEAIRAALMAATRAAHEQSGIEFPSDLIEVRLRKNKQGQPTFQGRIAYRGPLNISSLPRVLLDITQHELVLDPPEARRPFHAYPDRIPDDCTIATYSLNELLAEKTRALYERTRPRDLYDVVYLLDNRPEAFDLPHVQGLFERKCAGKGFAMPALREFLEVVKDEEELESEWSNMLGSQLPVLPALVDLMGRLEDLLGWIDQPALAPAEATLGSAPITGGTSPVAPEGIRYWDGAPLEAIRFAAGNRLLVEFMYDGKHRIVEPYSLRRASTGNLLLFAWEQGAGKIKAFNVAKIASVRSSGTSFTPRYRIELSPSGPVVAAPMAMSAGNWTSPMPRRSSPRRPTRARRSSLGPRYVFACSYCQKRFTHSSNDSSLRKHKNRSGWDCPGRHGYLVATK
jgi:predicted nucleotidyltransferase component of viral defense system